MAICGVYGVEEAKLAKYRCVRTTAYQLRFSRVGVGKQEDAKHNFRRAAASNVSR